MQIIVILVTQLFWGELYEFCFAFSLGTNPQIGCSSWYLSLLLWYMSTSVYPFPWRKKLFLPVPLFTYIGHVNVSLNYQPLMLPLNAPLRVYAFISDSIFPSTSISTFSSILHSFFSWLENIPLHTIQKHKKHSGETWHLSNQSNIP